MEHLRESTVLALLQHCRPISLMESDSMRVLTLITVRKVADFDHSS